MPSIPQQHPSDNTIEPDRRERVADPARELICCQRAVEAARAGHRVFLPLVLLRRRWTELCARLGGVEATGAVLLRR